MRGGHGRPGRSPGNEPFLLVAKGFYVFASIALFGISLMMIGIGLWDVLSAWQKGLPGTEQMLTAIGLIVIAIAVFDVSKYLMEEEVLRQRELRSAAEARETLTKFLVIITIAVSLEALVFVFGAGKQDVRMLLYPTFLLAVSALLVVALGVYQRLSTAAETERREPPQR